MHGKGDAMRVRIEMAYETLLDSIDDPNALNSSLLKHVLAGRRASERSWSISLASDKAAVCGLSLDFGAFVTPNNVCSIAVPQAVLWGFGVYTSTRGERRLSLWFGGV